MSSFEPRPRAIRPNTPNTPPQKTTVTLLTTLLKKTMKTVLGLGSLLLLQQGTNAFVATSSRGAQCTELNVERSRRDVAKSSFGSFLALVAAGLPTSATAEIDQVCAISLCGYNYKYLLSFSTTPLSLSLETHDLQFSLPSYDQSKGVWYIDRMFTALWSSSPSRHFYNISRRSEVNRLD